MMKQIIVYGGIVGVVLFIGITAVEAAPRQDIEVFRLKADISSTRNRIQEIKQEVEKYQKEAAELSISRRTLESELARLSAERKKLERQVQLTESKIDLASLEIENLHGSIGYTERSIVQNRSSVSRSLRRVYELDQFSLMEQLLSGEDFSDFWDEASTLILFQERMKSEIESLELLKNDLGEKQQASLARQKELVSLRENTKDQKSIVDQSHKSREQLISETKNEETRFQKLISEKEKLISAFEQELFEYESRLKFVLDPTSLPGRGSAPLSWPLDSVFITQRFGKTVDSERLYASGSHSGVDLRANGDKVYAMADGVVTGVGDTDVACRGASFGKWVYIRYDNNLASTFGHLSVIKVSPGEKVKRGQLVAYSGNTGHSTAPHLHVTVYAGVDGNGNSPVEVQGSESIACKGKILIQPRAPRNAYLDPLDYLPTTTTGDFKGQ